MAQDLDRLLAEGLAQMEVAADAGQRERLLVFLQLLRKWNRVYNLTSITDPVDMVRLHLLDSLAVLPHLKGRRVLDVGTGAGLPGIPLALMSGEKDFTLLDGNSKKTRFVQQAIIELGLRNARVAHARIERYADPEGFDVILARAFASLPVIVEHTRRLLAPGGVILAQKGKWAEQDSPTLFAVESVPLKIPGVDAERHLLSVTLPG
jgi:16S rRNA (guanine527-N7)-methyltransferase